ncbi:MAG: NYN domain-containing protein, partial [Caldilineaceae bacterium]|nr:NYN domain-containing protein [Caldilineaceae bacterium]
VIISGDSDFGPLVTKLREYGKYTLGIGPRDVTHPLLVRACDEFVYIEAALGEFGVDDALSETAAADQEAARQLLLKALRVHEQRDDLPVLAAKLKQTMLLLEPTFNEVNIGHTQFKEWLERSTDLVTLYARENQIYVALPDFEPGPEWEARPWPSSSHANGQAIRTAPALASAAAAEPAVPVKLSLRQQYNQIFTRLKMTSVDFATRRDVLRDIYRELRERPGERTTDELLEELCERYETQGLIRSKTTLRQIWQMG